MDRRSSGRCVEATHVLADDIEVWIVHDYMTPNFVGPLGPVCCNCTKSCQQTLRGEKAADGGIDVNGGVDGGGESQAWGQTCSTLVGLKM